jgi:endonuclease YncB( thermonuclease family)
MTSEQNQFTHEVVPGKSQTNVYWTAMKKEQLFISFLMALCLFTLFPAYGEEVLIGSVIKVVDGDTLDVQVGPGKHRIRLAEIDAPERNQPWGDEAKQGLAFKVLKQEVRVVVTDTDRYGRQVGKIFLGQTDINRSMVSEGHAWVYRQYSQDERLIEIEIMAREAGVGLWNRGDAVPPWDWRKGKRSNRRPGRTDGEQATKKIFNPIG